jgi:putative Holliday junction resolvase
VTRPHPASAGVALGVDLGQVRVGLAATDPTGTIASPVGAVDRHPAEALWRRLRQEAADRGAVRLVVGLPKRMAGDEGPAAAAAREFAAEAQQATGLRTELWDERLTTVQAERSLIAAGVRRRRRRAVVDAVAAALMLQAWLEAQRTSTAVGPVSRR